MTIYIKKNFLEDSDLLEYAEEINQVLIDSEFDFSAVKEDSDNTKRDTLVVKPPISVLNEMLG